MSIRKQWRWILVATAAVAGWMLGAQHDSARGDDFFEVAATYTAQAAIAVEGSGVIGQPVRAANPADEWIPRGHSLQEWDIKTGKVTAQIALPNPAGAVALCSDGKTAFVTTGPAIAIIDTAAKKITRLIDLACPPTAIAWLPGTPPHLIVAIGSTVMRINVAHNSAQSVDVGGSVSALVAGGDDLFAIVAGDQKIVALNAPDGTISDTWTLDAKPLVAALDDAHHRLLVACDDQKLRVLDTNTGKVVDTQSISAGATGICMCPAVSTAFVATPGAVDVLHQDDASDSVPH